MHHCHYNVTMGILVQMFSIYQVLVTHWLPEMSGNNNFNTDFVIWFLERFFCVQPLKLSSVIVLQTLGKNPYTVCGLEQKVMCSFLSNTGMAITSWSGSCFKFNFYFYFLKMLFDRAYFIYLYICIFLFSIFLLIFCLYNLLYYLW